jgi:hypothetical protein
MVLIKCQECARDVSSRAAACPHCGCPVSPESEVAPRARVEPIPEPHQRQPASHAAALPSETAPQSRRASRSGWWIGGILLFAILIQVCVGSSDTSKRSTSTPTSQPSNPTPVARAKPASTQATESDKKRWIGAMEDELSTPGMKLAAAQSLIAFLPDSPEGKKAQGMLKELTDAVAYEKSGQQWSYDSDKEEMTGKPIQYAIVTSTNTVDFDFPYSGEQRAKLTLRRHPRWGNDVILALDRGQILCHSHGDCSIALRFDEGRFIRLQGNPPGDNSTETVFLPAFSTFMKELPGASSLRVEVKIYQHGAPVFAFDVSGFKPEKFK